jgi:putative membrane protein
MIDYDRNNWWRATFAFHGTVLPHVLGRVAVLTAFCLALNILDDEVLDHYHIDLPRLEATGHQVLGVALSMLIVFRTNSSNNRYWEARAFWGSIVNTSRNLARLGALYAGPADELARLTSAYVVAVRENLRGHRDPGVLRPMLSGRILDRVMKANNPPSMLARFLSEWIRTRQQEGHLDTMQAYQLQELVCRLVDNQGACERVHKTPLPFVYAALIKQILLVYLATLPFVLAPQLGFAAPMVVAVVSLGMLGIEEAGVLIEDPFQLDPNHLPLEQICETITRDTLDLTTIE